MKCKCGVCGVQTGITESPNTIAEFTCVGCGTRQLVTRTGCHPLPRKPRPRRPQSMAGASDIADDTSRMDDLRELIMRSRASISDGESTLPANADAPPTESHDEADLPALDAPESVRATIRSFAGDSLIPLSGETEEILRAAEPRETPRPQPPLKSKPAVLTLSVAAGIGLLLFAAGSLARRAPSSSVQPTGEGISDTAPAAAETKSDDAFAARTGVSSEVAQEGKGEAAANPASPVAPTRVTPPKPSAANTQPAEAKGGETVDPASPAPVAAPTEAPAAKPARPLTLQEAMAGAVRKPSNRLPKSR